MLAIPKLGSAGPNRTYAFQINRTEITNRMYRSCELAKQCSLVSFGGERNEPVRVTFHQAEAFCAWQHWRLPAAAEWLAAATAGDGRRYPWGNSPAPKCGDVALFGHAPCLAKDRTEVGTHPMDKSPFGVMDMLGNGPEWTVEGVNQPRVMPSFVDHVEAANLEDVWLHQTSGQWREGSSPTDSGYDVSQVGFRCAVSGDNVL